jgi:CHAT domain-containing protein
MKEKILILDIKRDNTLINESDANITVSVHYDDDHGMTNYETHQISLVEINRLTNEILTAIDKTKHSPTEQYKVLEQNGKMLCDELLPVDKKKALIDSDADYLLLRINDHLVHIPFELIFLKDQFLCQKFAIGRDVKTQQTVHSDYRKQRSKKSIWGIHNPTGDLAFATDEGKAIRKLLKQFINVKINRMHIEPNVSRDQVKSRICDYDIVHFAGHAHFDKQSPEKSGWKFKDGIFSAKDIAKLSNNKALPNIVFSNACQSGRTTAWENQLSVYGLANAFKLAGVKHYIGTFSNIPDTTSQSFACLFYQYLLSGETLGMAMHKARKSLIDDQKDLCWASYHLYGDPRTRYFDVCEDQSDISSETPIQETVPVSNISDRSDAVSDYPDPPVKTELDDQEVVETEKIVHHKKVASNLNVLKQGTILLCVVLSICILYYLIKHDKPPTENPMIPVMDNWTSTPKSVAVLFDEKDNELTDTIQKSMCHAFEKALCHVPRFKLLERRHIDLIKAELDLWMSKYSSIKDSYIPQVLPCDILIFVDMTPMIGKTELCIKMIQPSNTQQPEIIISKLPPERLYGPYDPLCKQLIETLYKFNPLRGKIVEIAPKIKLDIGKNVGVEVDQLYRIVTNSAILKVISVEPDISYVDTTVQGADVRVGARVLWQNNQF